MDTKALRQKILDLAIRGKLVPQDPDDEPASVLLERIRAEKERLIQEGKIKRPKKSNTSDKPHYGKTEGPFEIPESWEWVKLIDIAYVASGSTPAKECFVPKGIPYLKMYNLKNQQIEFETNPQYILKEIHEGQLYRSKCYEGDLIMNIVGPPLGKLAIIPPNIPECNINQAAVVIRSYLYSNVTNLYLRYFLWEMSAINSITTRGNAGQDNISLTQCQNLLIPFPPIEAQKRIIKEIDHIFNLINAIEQNQGILSEIILQTKSKILSFAIQGKLVSQDSSDEPAAKLLKSFNPSWEPCDTSHYRFNIPENWIVVKLTDICKSIFAGGDKPNFVSRNFTKEFPYPIYSNGIENNGLYGFSEDYRVKDKALTISARGTIGFTCIREPKFTPIIRLITLIPLEYVDLSYVKIALDSLLLISEGSSIPQLTVPTISNLLIPLPPFDEQKRIVEKVEGLFKELDAIKAELTNQ